VDYYGISMGIMDQIELLAAARLAVKGEFAAVMPLVHNHGVDVDNVALGAVLAGDQGMAWQLFDKVANYDCQLAWSQFAVASTMKLGIVAFS
jgi:hypothetical protein